VKAIQLRIAPTNCVSSVWTAQSNHLHTYTYTHTHTHCPHSLDWCSMHLYFWKDFHPRRNKDVKTQHYLCSTPPAHVADRSMSSNTVSFLCRPSLSVLMLCPSIHCSHTSLPSSQFRNIKHFCDAINIFLTSYYFANSFVLYSTLDIEMTSLSWADFMDPISKVSWNTKSLSYAHAVSDTSYIFLLSLLTSWRSVLIEHITDIMTVSTYWAVNISSACLIFPPPLIML
jgi:hypothetical protein